MEVVAEGGQVDGTSNERPVDENTFPQPAQSGGAGEEVQEAQTRHCLTRQDRIDRGQRDRIASIPHSRNQHRLKSLIGASQQDKTS